jgi:hypothetical protein
MKTYSKLVPSFLFLILVVPPVGADEPPKDGEEVTVWSDSSGKFKVGALLQERQARWPSFSICYLNERL